MKKLTLLFFILLACVALVPAQQIEKCYRLDGLKDEDSVYLTIAAAKVKGEFMIRREYDDEMTERYPFTGTAAGNIVTVKFSGKKPDSLPAKQTTYSWTIVTTPTREYLRVQFYGRNYDNNKYSNYFSELESCRPVYGFFAKSPKVIRFAKGQKSTSIETTFPDNKGYRTFLISARKGQSLDITAPGCSILVYLPDKKLYEYLEGPDHIDAGKASIALDMLSLSPLPQIGNYLVVLQVVGDDMSPRNIEFKITG
jgi:hypothetical protein